MNLKIIPSRITTTAAALVTTFLGGSVVYAVPLTDVPSAPPAQKQADSDTVLPEVMDVLRRAIDASGGEARHRALRTRVTHGTLRMDAMGIEGTLRISQDLGDGEKNPPRMATLLNLGGLGEQRQVFDGTIGWEISSMAGPRLLSSEEVNMLRMQGGADAMLEPETFFEDIMKLVGRSTFADEPVYEVVMTMHGGAKTTSFFSIATGHQVGSKSTQPTQMGDIEAHTTMSDFREVDGFTFAHQMTITIPAMGMTQVVTINRVEHDVELDPALFAMTDDIRRLYEREQERKREAEKDAPQP